MTTDLIADLSRLGGRSTAYLTLALLLASVPATADGPPGLQTRGHYYPAETFQDAIVNIRVDYEAQEILVDKEMVMIYYDPVNKDPRRPRQIRWVVEGLAEGDMLVIRPKPGSSRTVLSPETRGKFVIPGRFNSVRSGLPRSPKFDAEGSVNWEYNIEVWRGEELVLFKDPAAWIEKDG